MLLLSAFNLFFLISLSVMMSVFVVFIQRGNWRFDFFLFSF